MKISDYESLSKPFVAANLKAASENFGYDWPSWDKTLSLKPKSLFDNE